MLKFLLIMKIMREVFFGFLQTLKEEFMVLKFGFLGCLGGVLEAAWAILGGPWGCLGPGLGRLKASWTALGAYYYTSQCPRKSCIMRKSFFHMVHNWGLDGGLRGSWAALGWCLWRLWRLFGGLLGGLVHQVGASWDALKASWPQLGRPNPSKSLKRRSLTVCFDINFDIINS